MTGSVDDDRGMDVIAWDDVIACQQVVLRFTGAFDAGDTKGMLADFAPDGVWYRQDGVVRGHSELQALMEARSPKLFVRHVVTNLRVRATGAGSAECVSYVVVYRDDDAGSGPARLHVPHLLGRYHDELRKSGATWSLASRRVSVDMKQV